MYINTYAYANVHVQARPRPYIGPYFVNKTNSTHFREKMNHSQCLLFQLMFITAGI